MAFVEAKSYISRYKKSIDRHEKKINMKDIPNMVPLEAEFNLNLSSEIINSNIRQEERKKVLKYYGKEGILELVYKIVVNDDFITGIYIYHYFLKPLLANFITLDTSICSYHIGINDIYMLDGINYLLRRNKYLTWQWKGQDIRYLKQLDDKYLNEEIKDINDMNVNKAFFNITATASTKLLFITSDVANINDIGIVNIIILSLRCLDRRGFGIIRIGDYIKELTYLLTQLRDFYENVSIVEMPWASSPKYYIYYSQLQYRDVEDIWRKLLAWSKKIEGTKKTEINNCFVLNHYINDRIKYDSTSVLDIYFNGE